ncbi:MAG: thioredoxin domain-containing protein [Cellulomonas sp.]
MPNRLARATSPYLQQHAENPVDWYEWGEEAFAEARRRDVPLLISIGYAACHWCHVMAHESFEDPATAAVMNAHVVAVKVDREERPDVDAVYMDVTRAMTGGGGWPMTVFATPDGEPFYAGTYFPPNPSHGLPSFVQVLEAMHDAWTTRRDEVERSVAGIRAALAGRLAAQETSAPVVDPAVLRRALTAAARSYDGVRGGFGGAPKFPPSMLLEWLLRRGARRDVTGGERPGAPEALAMAERTLEAMARGGMYDQLGGGFARYSVDAAWLVPHFEKMLYDNALLLRVYAHWWRATGSPLARRVAEETAVWLLRELRTPEGGFASSLDADSIDVDTLDADTSDAGRGPGHAAAPLEGAFYVWDRDDLVAALGADDAAWAAMTWGVTMRGTFERGASVLQLPVDPADAGRHEAVRTRLLAARGSRPRPARDDKVVASWNGLAIAALADAGDLFERPEWVRAAVDAAEHVTGLHMRRDGSAVRLARTSRDGAAGTAPGVLEDYANLADGLLALCQATGAARWLTLAGELLGDVLVRFSDGRGGFYDTAHDETDAVLVRIGRPREIADGPTPSGQAAAAGALLTYAALTGSDEERIAAERALREPLLLAEQYPQAAGWALAVAEALLDGPREVAVVGPAGDPGTEALRRVAVLSTAPGAVRAIGTGHAATRAGRAARRIWDSVPLLDERPMIGGRPTAYV